MLKFFEFLRRLARPLPRKIDPRALAAIETVLSMPNPKFAVAEVFREPLLPVAIDTGRPLTSKEAETYPFGVVHVPLVLAFPAANYPGQAAAIEHLERCLTLAFPAANYPRDYEPPKQEDRSI